MAKDRVSFPNQALEAEKFLRTIIRRLSPLDSLNESEPAPFALIAGPVLVP
jgi:hypothetical protein